MFGKTNNDMEKVIRNGQVAVLFSPGFGAGWYTWNTEVQLLFHPKLVELVEDNKTYLITEGWCRDNLGICGVFCGGTMDLQIEWVNEGNLFKIDEYDGNESVSIVGDSDYIVA